MQQSEAFERQLRETYAAIVAESFAHARHCLGLARSAKQAGDRAQVRKWVWSVRVLRMAAAEWRNRAQRMTPMLVCLIWLLGCTTPAALRVTDAVGLPHALVSRACEENYTRNVVTLQSAEILYSGDVPWALDCDLYDFGFSDHRRVLVDFRHSTAAVDQIRDYLRANGVRVPLRVL
jgi:hypothetical protein